MDIWNMLRPKTDRWAMRNLQLAFRPDYSGSSPEGYMEPQYVHSEEGWSVGDFLLWLTVSSHLPSRILASTF